MAQQNQTRQQLTLFVNDNRAVIEQIRGKFNPVQHQLISAHATLCREDEIANTNSIIETLASLKLFSPLKIKFDAAERFEGDKGVWLPGSSDNEAFHELRKTVLRGIMDAPRLLRPHITLMHPRNSTCTDLIFDQIKQFDLPKALYFDKISLIEQKNGSSWNIIKEFNITAA